MKHIPSTALWGAAFALAWLGKALAWVLLPSAEYMAERAISLRKRGY